MSLLIKALFFILLICSCAYLGNAGSDRRPDLLNPSLDKVKTHTKTRKLVGMMDYDQPGANPGHDPQLVRPAEILAEAHVQAMQFEKAVELCKRTLEIHRVHNEPASLEEASESRLMALVSEAKGDYDTTLEHLVLASIAVIANGQDNEVAAIDVSIGNIYLSLYRFNEAIFSYQKALANRLQISEG
ncbi:hypothetical protein MLD38_027675 [Melastoma candidum]|uniref:Uncharacterized protein n=1 Tax=Melastoma candidum TaxID=119954 RepID=A0ACB9P2B4_9MYRT|nr:hypothetical protein MLD38_027675 [Melastoma candidum]